MENCFDFIALIYFLESHKFLVAQTNKKHKVTLKISDCLWARACITSGGLFNTAISFQSAV